MMPRLKLLAACRQWSTLVGHHVIEEFFRDELRATSTVIVDRESCNMEGHFQDPGPIRKANPAATSQEEEHVAKRNKLLEST